MVRNPRPPAVLQGGDATLGAPERVSNGLPGSPRRRIPAAGADPFAFVVAGVLTVAFPGEGSPVAASIVVAGWLVHRGLLRR